MKMKTFSKIAAIALTAMMTTCMTACEDERDVPAYVPGTVFQTSSQDISGPRATVELEESHIDGDLLCLHLIIKNNNSAMTPSELISVKVVGGDKAKYVRVNYDGEHYDASQITTDILERGKEYHIAYGFTTAYTNSSTAAVTVTDRATGEVIGEWTVSVSGIMDSPWDAMVY